MFRINAITALLLTASSSGLTANADQLEQTCRSASCDYQNFPSIGEAEPIMHFLPGLQGTEKDRRRKLSTSLINFEAVGNLVPVGSTYAGDGVIFSPNAYGLTDSDVGGGGGSGNIGGLPSPDNAMFFFSGSFISMNAITGCELGVSFFYSAVYQPGFVSAYDGFDGTGNLLATKMLPLTPENGAPDPTGAFSPLLCTRLAFSGYARSIIFGGSPNQIVFDDIKCGPDTTCTTPPQEFFD